MAAAEWLHEETGRQLAERGKAGAGEAGSGDAGGGVDQRAPFFVRESFAAERAAAGAGSERSAGREVTVKGNRPAHTGRLQRCPEYRDPRALVEHGIAGIVPMAGRVRGKVDEGERGKRFCGFADLVPAMAGMLIHARCSSSGISPDRRAHRRQQHLN